MTEPETGPYRWEVNAEAEPGDTADFHEETFDNQQAAFTCAKSFIAKGYDVCVWMVDVNGSILRIWDNETLPRKETTDAF